MRRLRLLFFGTPEFAVPSLQALLRSSHEVVGVVSQPDRPRGRGQHVSASPVKQVALSQQVPVLQPERLKDASFVHALGALGADLGVVAAYGRILPEAVLAVPPLGLINVHGSLLPKYRGAAPVARAIMAGEQETGVTIMRVVRALDAGAMFASIRRQIEPNEDSATVERDLSLLGASLLVQVVDAIAEDRATEVPQNEAESTYAPRLTKEEGLIDWNAPAERIHNQVRGLRPWPHAYTFQGGRRIIVLQTAVDDALPIEAPHPPGTVVAAPPALKVWTGDQRTLEIQTLQLGGGKPLSVRDFMAGHRVTTGERFGGPSRS